MVSIVCSISCFVTFSYGSKLDFLLQVGNNKYSGVVSCVGVCALIRIYVLIVFTEHPVTCAVVLHVLLLLCGVRRKIVVRNIPT